MKIAKVRYVGPQRTDHRTGPSGKKYLMQKTVGSPASGWVPVESVKDALEFDSTGTLEVEWTSTGKVARDVGVPLTEVGSHLKDLSYRKKQSVAKALGVKANQKESQLEAAIMEAAEALNKENQH